MLRRTNWITLFWPGLTQLWYSGTAWGLAIACTFAWLLNLAILSTFVWNELFDLWLRIGVWVLLVGVWGACVTLSFRQLIGLDPENDEAAAEALFRRAGREYLIGNWIHAEQVLTELLRKRPQDVDAQLMLATLLRRTGQWSEAARRLRRLEATEGAGKWSSEIRRERRALDRVFNQPAAESTTIENELNPSENQQLVDKRFDENQAVQLEDTQADQSAAEKAA